MRVKRDARLDLLARVELFAGCNLRQLIRIASLSTEITLPAGEVLFREGEPGREAFVLLDGTAAVSVGERAIAVLQPGAVFGDLGLVEHQRRLATVTATSPISVLVLTPQELSALLESVPAVATRVRLSAEARRRALELAS